MAVFRDRTRPTPGVQILNPNDSAAARRITKPAPVQPDWERSRLPARRDSNQALVAAGQKVDRQLSSTYQRLIQPWQIRAFAYYDTIGEVKYASQFYSRMLSGLRLFPGIIQDDGTIEEDTDPDAQTALARIQDPGGGMTNLLAAYGRLMFLVGEAILFVSTDRKTGLEQWEMLSQQEVRLYGNTYQRMRAPSLGFEEYRPPDNPDDEEEAWVPVGDADVKEAVAYRLWQRHPLYSSLADSTMQGILSICEELLLLEQALRARLRSRLASAGFLIIDERVTALPLEGQPDEDSEEDPILSNIVNAMLSPISDEGTASAVVPLVLRVSTGEGTKVSDLIYHLQVVDPTQYYPETGLRLECIRRMAIGLDMPPEYLEGMGDVNHWCADEETAVLTTDGWKFQSDLQIGDVALTLNHETGESEWQPVMDIYRATVEHEPMRALQSRTHNSLTTPDHRWPVIRDRWTNKLVGKRREWRTSSTLGDADSIITAAPYSAPTDPVYDDAFVELVAWFWTEGHDGGNLSIAQSHTKNPGRVERIRRVLRNLYGESVETLRGTHGPAWREKVQPNKSSFGGPVTVFYLNKSAASAVLEAAPQKQVTREFVLSLTRHQLDLFVEISCQADGHHYASGEYDIWQRDEDALDAFELALVLSGRAVSTSYGDGRVVRALKATSVRPVKAAREAARTDSDGATDRIELYSGVIWCPSTPNGTWFARRRGKSYFTGNSAWSIDEQTWKQHGQQKAQQLVDDVTSAYYRPYLRDVLQKPDWDKRVVAYDASKIINHPDRSKDAKDLFDRVALSKKALREATGFTDDDAPSDDERAERIGIMTRDSSLAWDGVPSVKAGGIEPEPGVIVSGQAKGAIGTPEATGEAQADAQKGPPAGGPEGAAGGEGLTGALLLGRVMMAGDMGLIRARHLAGSKVWSLLNKDPELREEFKTARKGDLAALLGRERLRKLNAPSERDLCAGARVEILEALRLVNGLDHDQREQIADAIEQHALRTLYEPTIRPLPDTFARFLIGARGGH
jgi:hypothetical protein